MALGITSPLLASVPGVSHRFFQRIGGTSPNPWRALNTSYDGSDAPGRVDENLARVRFQIGVGKDDLYAVTQVHGSAVVIVDGSEEPADVRTRKGDAVMTRAHGVAVGVRTADCAPILIAADDGSVVAAVHAGWRGAVGGVIEAAVMQMCSPPEPSSLPLPPNALVAAVGPCIGLDAFEVGPEVVAAARTVVGADVDAMVKAGQADRMHLDLAALCVRILQRAGIERVERVGTCTVTDETHYFSHRRDVTLRKSAETGRQMSAIAIASPPNLDDEAFR